MLVLFRNQHLFSYPLLLAYCFIIKIGFLIFPNGAHLVYQKYYASFESILGNQSTNFFISVFLIFIQSVWFNIIVSKTKILEEKSFGPGMVFCTISTLFAEFNYFNLPLIVNFGILYLLDQMVSMQNYSYEQGRYFNIGFISGLLGLVHADFLVLLPISIFCLLAIKPILFREFLIFLLAFITPFYIFFGVGYVLDQFPQIDIKQHFFQFRLAKFPINKPNVIVLGCSVLALLFYGFIQNRNLARFSSVKIKRTMEWFFVFSLGFAFITAFSNSTDLDTFFYLSVPFSFYIALFFFRIKQNALAEFIHFVFLGLIIVFELIPQ